MFLVYIAIFDILSYDTVKLLFTGIDRSATLPVGYALSDCFSGCL